ncbi:MobC family plasmid mobilization relaxosome protein [Jiella marina]|uniref:MobC family plasmid mobilization relaxosome protein n=1 Tax=Jiella sp. LLJ827 TaxID=2917712 RepID=UPI0021008937|nr:MobC family plasmid mobilization relaxosome protein [Jiella sp. LLJ827]MCQ0990613.1 MobC family plasmid mobilization relaxosome protein [Jiella sp. LLJ827]
MTQTMRTIGRPRKAKNERRDERLPDIRVTAAERAYVEEQAAQAGMSATEFCRRAILRQKVTPRRSSVDDRALFELNRVGVNLHQIVKALNFRQGTPTDIVEVLAEVRSAVAKVAADGP